MFVILAVSIGLLLIGTIHGYLWWRLVKSTTTSPRWRRVGLVVAAALGTLLFAAVAVRDSVSFAPVLAWPGYIWLGLMFYLLVLLVLLEIPRGVLALVRRSRRTPVDENRRVLINRSLALGAVLGAGAIGGYGMKTALSAPRIEREDITLRRLDPTADGLQIAVVSDIHLGALLGRGFAQRTVDRINALEPDLIAVVGDLVDGPVDRLRNAVEPLADLAAPLGAYFVTGNHEYFTETDAWLRELDRLGLRTLRNERVALTYRGARIDLAGVNDIAGEDEGDGPDHDRAMSGRDPTVPVIMMAHQPVQIDDSVEHGVDLQLSGHTHGGQIYPFHHLVRIDQPAVAGLSRKDDTYLYVTRGAGFWGPPMRVGAPPEISLLTLRASRSRVSPSTGTQPGSG